jgi:L-fucose isomerase
MGIAGSIVNADFLQQYLGMRTEYVSLVEILRRVDFGIYDKEEFEKAMQWVEKYCKPQEGHDYNEDRPLFPGVPMTTFNGKGKGKNRQEKDEDWEFTVKNMMIIRDLMQGSEKLLEMGYKEEAIGHNAIAAGVQGQRQWTDYKPNFDFPESMMCTSFDWNGPREANILATENDFLNGMSMLFGHLLTNKGVMFSDIRTYWSPEAVERVSGWKAEGGAANGFIHLINSGATTLDATGAMKDQDGKPTMKSHWEMTKDDMEACLKATNWMPADRDYFRGGGYSSHFLTKGGMPMTMLRLNLVAGLGPVLQLAEGWTVDLPANVNDILDKRTDPTWPTTWFAPRLDATKDAFKDVYSVMNNWGANHGAICYGHVGADLITLAAMLRIPVCMHNVEDKDIFRPACWNSFGMDKEGADYRACANFGPLYK